MDFRQRLEQNRNTTVSRDQPVAEPPLALAAETDEHFSCRYFATERNANPACLDLRLRGGARKALPYAFVTEMNFDIDRGIEILTQGKRVTITGRNLSRLFDCLIAYRVRFIQANIGSDADEDGLFVGEITVAEVL